MISLIHLRFFILISFFSNTVFDMPPISLQAMGSKDFGKNTIRLPDGDFYQNPKGLSLYPIDWELSFAFQKQG
ncbi:hypothetical protein DMA11_11830 [Marinilabiliaceae bacterium JC017]|nr:hypothetical protein DMA11_11830 [Marinilabiliaceae bacterium JC017]